MPRQIGKQPLTVGVGVMNPLSHWLQHPGTETIPVQDMKGLPGFCPFNP